MKKFLMLMMIMLIGFGLMGAVQDTATFGISLSVPAVYEVKIAEADATNVGQFNSATAVNDIELVYGVQDSATFYLLVKTNDRANLKVQAKLEHLKAPSIATMIAYSLKSGTTVLGESEQTATTYRELLDVPASAGNGLRVVSKPFLVELLSDGAGLATNSFELASVGEYSTSIVVELITL